MDAIRKGPDMVYVRNLPAWERWGRGLGGLGLAVFGVAAQWGRLAGWALIGAGGVALLTAFVCLCPMGATVGPKPPTAGCSSMNRIMAVHPELIAAAQTADSEAIALLLSRAEPDS